MSALRDSSPEHPASVRAVNEAIRDWVRRLGPVWIEGQLAQVRIRGDVAYLTLRDLSTEHSVGTVVAARTLQSLPTKIAEGQRVIVQGRPEFWAKNGDLKLRLAEVRPVGVGQLLAELERLKNLLQAEGLFRPELKKPLPFLPRRVGLICGRASDAERDVVTNARDRWPTVQFEMREVAVQGMSAVSEVGAALAELDAMPEVDVIVITRGGGGVEDLLPFSNEALVRAVARATTPVVSAIGHEKDSPILDLVADFRASTPTDAGKRVVPDMAEEQRRIRDLRTRSGRATAARFEAADRWLADIRRRAVLADPQRLIDTEATVLAATRERAWRVVAGRIENAATDLEHVRARVRALSPAATLDRGYAVVQDEAGAVVRRAAGVRAGQPLRIRVADGRFAVQVTSQTPGEDAP